MNFINRILIAFAGLCISLSACSSEPSENTEIYIPLDRQIQNARRNTSSASFEIAGAKYKRISGNIVAQNKQRLIFNMRYFDDMKYEDMSEILGTTVGALKASYHHAVKKIEKFFECD